MARYVRLRELLVAVEGLALLRHLYDGSDADADRRLTEICSLLDDDELSAGDPTPELDARDGYRAWAESYDEPGNSIVELEQPVVWAILDELPAGRALDAACGTGRHTARLAERGHDVLGIDVTPEVVRRAAAAVPSARFVEADLRSIPADDCGFHVAVCGLALSHLSDLSEPVGELARVLQPGGRLVVSVLHPFQVHLGWHATFAGADGSRGFVREHAHTHADYLAAFRAAGLSVRNCIEPKFTSEHAAAKRRAFRHIPEATAEAYAGLPGVLIWDLAKD